MEASIRSAEIKNMRCSELINLGMIINLMADGNAIAGPVKMF